MEEKKMKLRRFVFWPYVLVASLLSYLLFLISGSFILDDKEAVIAISGVLIAGSWSFLSIETNKEIRRRDEVIRFLNEYEEAVLGYVYAVGVFFENYSKLKTFTVLSNLSKKDIENKRLKEEPVQSDIDNHIFNYSGEKKGVLFDELIKHLNMLIYKETIVKIKGNLLLLCVSSDKEINIIDKLCDSVTSDANETASKNNVNLEEPVFKVNAEELVDMQKCLFIVLSEKMKNFEERSEDYSEKQNLCVFLIIFGFFFSFWNFINFQF